MAASDQPGSNRDLAQLLLDLGAAIRAKIVGERDLGNDHCSLGFQGGDVLYALDRRVEPVIAEALAGWPEALKPLAVVAEGFGEDGHMVIGEAGAAPRHRLLIDPIDGTRNLMFDKRPAWFLAAIAEDRGAGTRLSDSLAAAMVELPPAKQEWADAFAFAAGSPLIAARVHTGTGETAPLAARPSARTGLQDGFAHVVNFFPGTKELAAALMERIADRTIFTGGDRHATLFDDQYISTGGQFAELMLGRDLVCCDLRPLFHEIQRRQAGGDGAALRRGPECHPYDIAGLAVARQAGVILTDGFGAPLDAPFDIHTPIHWCGYANETLRALVEPVVQDWVREQLGTRGPAG